MWNKNDIYSPPSKGLNTFFEFILCDFINKIDFLFTEYTYKYNTDMESNIAFMEFISGIPRYVYVMPWLLPKGVGIVTSNILLWVKFKWSWMRIEIT